MADDAATATHPTAFLNKTLTALSYIWWPIGTLLKYIAALALYLAKLLYWPVEFLLQPVIYLARFILTCLLAPFRLLVKLETVYIYLGTAALVGLTIGLIISLIYGSLSNMIGSNAAPAAAAAAQSRLRSAREYRETKKRKKQSRLLADEAPAILSPVPASSPVRAAQRDYFSAGYGGGVGMGDHVRRSRRFHGLLDQTIMEATDSDF
ncbi:hypothetical protein KC367_g6641 [Hortaea werneckii]|uniref:Uncharacterized protein n=2 Tax=Hortaea werneckii TaxID=91943 RepID=A0A3M7IC39_HORWE|nr:hypothetical protein KC358_g14170 [Hortaea werneckii]OTA23360.1 hypothetical protein BTJ68_13514 [Hortaea werneckii EXF-2000]KAI6807256.1 hypothetical protein KC350_g13850 [Hortaea werneckii]KAI6904234.1 hypothetical protein KC348_g15412 [Hortaea werneckii]KAI6924804.1 hypothetical protein KC341_g13824 [Hortaea werneckii]